MSKFKVGDKVRRIKDSYHEMDVGDVDTIDSGGWAGCINLKKFGLGHTESRFELVEDVKFKVGDRVRVIDNYFNRESCSHKDSIGHIGIIDKISYENFSKPHIIVKGIPGGFWYASRYEEAFPKKELIETDMDTVDIKNFPKAVLVAAEKEAKKELAEDQQKIAVTEFKRLFAKIADKELELSRVQSELKDLRGKAAVAKK